MDNNKQKDKLRGSLIGGAVGDALGYPVEFMNSYDTSLAIAQFHPKDSVSLMDLFMVKDAPVEIDIHAIGHNRLFQVNQIPPHLIRRKGRIPFEYHDIAHKYYQQKS